MKLFGIRYLWFKLALVGGSLLGILLLVQSIQTYFQVSRGMVLAELRREAQRQVGLLQREAARLGLREPAELEPVLTEMQEEAPNRIAWIRILDSSGAVLAQAGNPVGPPLRPPQPQGMPADPFLVPGEIRQTPEGKVWVTVQFFGIGRRFRPLGQSPAGFPAPPQTAGNLQQAPKAASQPAPNTAGQPRAGLPKQSQSEAAPSGAAQAPSPPAGVRPGPRFVELGLYMSGVSAVFGTLLTNLILNSAAAVGLVASMVLLWLRFPNYVNGKRLEQQTELARKVQMDLLPPSKIEIADVDIAAQCVPAWQVGGDFYDVFSAPDGRVAIAVGDVSGKGLPASMVVGLLLGAVRASNWMGGKEEHESSTARLSELIRSRTAIERFVSLFWCYYDPGRRMLYYVNAGHLPPMLIGRDERGNPVVRRLEEGGPVLGVLAGVSYEQGEAEVRPGELLVMYSDGVVEAANASGAQFEEEGLLAVVLKNLEKPCLEIRDEVLRAVNAFMGEERAQDDITLVVARFLEKGVGNSAG